MKDTNKLNPEIRFSGFTDDWEQRKLGELGEIMTGSTPPTAMSKYYSEHGIPWVTPTDIEGNIISDTSKKLSEEGVKVGRVVPANTILCTCIASIGKNALLTVKGSFNQQINSLTPSQENNPYFLLTESELWSKELKRIAGAGTMQIVNKSEFSELSTMVPRLDEQQKIGEYFSNLDRLITLHQRKLNGLKNVKKAMLEKMFPKNGESVPEIRFSGFTDDWEQRKLGDCCEQIKETVDPQQNPDVKYWEYSMPAFDNGNKPDLVYGSGMNSIRKVINTSCLLINKLNVRKKRIWLVETPLNNAVCSAEFVPIVSENVDLRFIKYIVSENKFTRYLEDCSSGSSNSQKRVTPDVIMSAVIKVPTIAEQQKIGEYFSNLDRLITLHQRKLDKLKTLKKAMLEKMFI